MNSLSQRLGILDKEPVVVSTAAGVFEAYEGEIKEAKSLEKNFHSSKPSDENVDSLARTVLNALSFQYRIETLKKEAIGRTETIEDLLQKELLAWKGTISQYEIKEVTPSNLKTIQKLARYQGFAAVLLKNKKLVDEFFKLIFRDEFPVKFAVQYFKICSIDLQDCFLTKQLSFFHLHGKKILKITKEEKDGTTYKDLKFKINGQFVSILNENEQIETNNGNRTWKEIKEIWSKSKKLPAEMAIFEDEGMIFFKPQGVEAIVGDQSVEIDTKKEEFWNNNNLPNFLTISKKKLEELLDTEIPEDAPHVATIQGSYVDQEYVEDAHGASFIYLRNKNDSYRCLPFSKYAEKFPLTDKEKKDFIANTVKGKFTYPDPTPFYKHRTHAISFEFLDQEKVEALLSNYGKRVWNFQFAGNNCSKEWQLAFKEVLEIDQNYFDMHLLDAKFPKPLNYIFGIISWIDKRISSVAAFWLVHLVHVLLGSKRILSRTNESGEKETASIYDQFKNEQKLYVPGQLGKRIKENKIRGIIYFGGDKQYSNTRLV